MKGGRVIPERRSAFYPLPYESGIALGQWFRRIFSRRLANSELRHPVASYGFAVLLEVCVLFVSSMLARLISVVYVPRCAHVHRSDIYRVKFGSRAGFDRDRVGGVAY